MNKSKQTKIMKRFLKMAGHLLMTGASNQVYSQKGVGVNVTSAAADPSAVQMRAVILGFLWQEPRLKNTKILQKTTFLFIVKILKKIHKPYNSIFNDYKTLKQNIDISNFLAAK